jgi:hypothetical protein
MLHDPYHHDFLQQYFYISSLALAKGGGRVGKGGHTWPIPGAYVALNFGLLELQFPLISGLD